ncbi:SpoIIE family protein phosphatase [Streptomyces sp. RLB3-17]|uniref:SpoIIE family protein phosphatase n=1 Tax=unclassified Streptomyces TaxID=2593676 RepID=UPI0011630DC8|nr:MULTISPECIES: SpoIIE family protein phosphatase [unclassified Streptomyces]QDO03758.1 SpoIIE family protein phosphatase [Streptomyces sp. RLB1-9]QDO25489.1 SpoIIE family protein phosphatase [Streptomyces sp. S1A1-8]QDO35608.1 SpoIIE family protein phosphatase [Streptomyces sp. S1A1-3]QDO45627.1 SpoIIE family protein phosphatase [Streptomyces sp. RLB3-17]
MERLPTHPGERPHESDTSPGPARPAPPTPPPPATAAVDARGIVTEWSEGARQLLGYPPSEVVGQPAARLLADDADDAGTVGAAALRDAAGRERWSGTVALRHRDGRRLRRELLAHRRTADGPVTEWLVVSAVTGTPEGQTPAGTPEGEAPEGEAAGGGTSGSEAAGSGTYGSGRLGEWAFRQAPCVMAVFDADLRLVRANAGMEQVLSLTEDQMRGMRLPEIVPHPVSDETEAKMRRVLEGGGPQQLRAGAGPAGTGANDGWSTSLVPLEDPAGRVRAVCLAAHQRLQEHLARQRMLLLSEASARIGTTADSGRTAQELADIAVPRLADFAAVDLLDAPRHGGEPSPAAPAGPLAMTRTAVRSVLDDGPTASAASAAGTAGTAGTAALYPALSPVARCLAQGHGALYDAADPDLLQWARQDPGAARLPGSGTHSVMVVPMRAHGATLGVALFGRHRHAEPFEADDLWLAEELTAKAAVSIHTTRRDSREHTSTMTLQRSLLPQTLPDQGALDIATRYLPAGTRAGVGGDWFDVIPLSGARVALVVGDVVGHGIRASATMGRLRTAVRTLADVDLPPDELLTHLDDLVLHLSADEGGTGGADESAGGIGTTCLYAVYDPVSRRCALARAGHPPPAAVTPDGAVRFLDVPAGPPLGLGGLPFETFETELPEGSLLALYTDGLLAARDHDIDEALDKMFAALARPAKTLDTVCDRVLTAMLTHRPDDDIALLVARTRALHADRVAAWDLASDPAVVARARKHATEQLTAWGLDDAAFITELTVSELVTNAIRYGRPPIQLRLIHEDSTLTCEVFDSSSTAPHMRRARTFDEGGRGLLLVGQLARRWGTRHAVTGKTVWAEQSLSPG